MITLQNADAALKSYYLEALTNCLDNISPFYAAIEKKSECVRGKDVKLTIVAGRTGSVVAGDEDGNLPQPSKNRYLQLTAPLKNLYGTIEISDKALRASGDSSGAFVNLLNAEMEGLLSSAKQNFRRMLFGDGTALITYFDGATSVDREYYSSYLRDEFVGMQVDAYESDSDAPIAGCSGIYIEKINHEKGTLTLSKSITPDSGELYVHGAKGKELSGLYAVFHSDVLYGHDTSSESYFKPMIKSVKKAAVNEEFLCKIIDELEDNRDSKINMILTDYKTRRFIASLVGTGRRTVNSIDVNAGYGTVTVNNIPVIADGYCSSGQLIFVNTEDFALYQLCDWEWLEDEDGKILKQIPGKAAYSATLVKYAELICRRPYGQGMLVITDFNSAA